MASPQSSLLHAPKHISISISITDRAGT